MLHPEMSTLPVRTRDDWPQVLNSLGLHGAGAEVGVLRGEFSFSLLQNWKGSKLYLVDSWRHIDGLVDMNNPDHNGHLENMALAFQKIYAHGDRAVMIRERSASAARLFPDGSLDFVYIDAGHDYASIMGDLEAWAPKVRAGGLICGDDYADGTWVHYRSDGTTSSPTRFDVKTAVDEFAARNGFRVGLSAEDKPQWWLYRA